MDVNVGGLAQGFARVVTSRLRYLIVLFWIVAAAAYRYLPSVSSAQGGSIALLAPAHSRALAVEERSARLFSFPVLSRTLVVQRDPHGLSQAAQERAVLRAVSLDEGHDHAVAQIAGALPIVNTLGLFPASREKSTTAITYLLFKPSVGFFARDRLAERFAQTYVNRPDDALVGLTGLVPARVVEGNVITAALLKVELATIVLIAIVVGVTFRSLGAPLVVLLTAIISYTITLRGLGYAGARTGIAIPVELEPILVVLILAICTDYAVFFLAGAKRGLQAGEQRVATARATTAEFAPIILTAGLTVAGCTACLALAKLGFLRDLGLALAAGVALTVAVALTLVPACLASAGRVVFWSGVRARAGVAREGGESSPRQRLIRLLTRRPLAFLAAIVCAAVLVAASTGLRDMSIGLPVLNDLGSTTRVARATRAAGLGFAPGIVSPTVLLVEEHGIVKHGAGLARLEGLLTRQPGVAGVIGPREQPTGHAFGVVLAKNGGAARFVIILNADPYGSRAIADVRAMEGHMPALLRASGLSGAHAGFGGDTAISTETIDSVLNSLLPVGIAIGAVELLALGLLLRSLVAPLYLLVASALSMTAPLGLTAYLFQRRLGQADLAFYVPLGVGVLLIALGSDYNLFVTGRVWAEARARPLRAAITTAVPRASRAITTAAITLAASFALLAIVPLASFRAFAFAMAVGVLIDAFLVRSYLVPALMMLFGRVSLWPRREAPERAEGDKDEQPAAAAAPSAP